MADAESPASSSAFFVGPTVRSSRSCASSSSFARVSCRSRGFGPSCVAVMNGRLICVVIVDDSSIFAFSAASYSRCRAIGSIERSTPWSFLNSPTIQSTTTLSKLSPPRWLSPFVDFTSKTPSPSSSTDTSNVPPPRSKTRIVWSAPSLSRPYASAAAVGSLMIRWTLSPAILPASFVASRCALLKYAGTVITASVTASPRYASASALSFWRIIALISGGAYSLPPAVTRTSPPSPFTTSYGTIFISSETSSNLRPMKRLIEKIVFWEFVTCCRRAGAPTSRCPSFAKPTTDGVVRPPSAFGMTVGSPPSSTAIQELVGPRSIPIVFAMWLCLLCCCCNRVLRKSKPRYSRSQLGGGDADQRPAGDDHHRPEHEPPPDPLPLREDE